MAVFSDLYGNVNYLKRRLLVVTQHFGPENFRISDIVKGLVESGIDVDVICGIPNYPNGIIPNGYGMFKNRKQSYFGANIYRTFEITRKGNSNIRIFLNYISYPFFALFRILRVIHKKYDAVFCYQTSPVYMIFPAIFYSKLKHIPLTTYVLDLWPENLYSVLDIKNPFLRGVLQRTSHWHYKKSDKLIGMSESLSETLVRITDKDKSYVKTIPQYCEKLYEADVYDNELSKSYKDFFKIVYAGNISPAQNLEVAVDAAVLLKNDRINDIKFIIIGNGMSFEDIKRYAKEKNVEAYFDFLGAKPIEDIPKYHTLADALFASLVKSEDLGLTIPAKITSYMAAGKPILTCIDGEGSAVVDRAECGLTAPSGDAYSLYRNILSLYKLNKEEIEALGFNARKYHFKHHERETVLKQLKDFIFC